MNIKFADKNAVLGLILLVAISAVLIIQIFTLYRTSEILKSSVQKKPEETAFTMTKPMLGGDAIYCLYECGGKIGIYDAKSSILIDIIDVLVSSLPEADRACLKRGIEIYSFSDLSKIVDELTS